jgi:hypothetical protein
MDCKGKINVYEAPLRLHSLLPLPKNLTAPLPAAFVTLSSHAEVPKSIR